MKKRTLSKVICTECRNNQDAKVYHWSDYDERKWQQGIVECPPEYIMDENDIETPPKGCPYRLEHLMETQESPA